MDQKEAIAEKFSGLFVVRGRVVTNAGVAAKGLKVVAIDKSLGKDVVLGETITDSSGTYSISYKEEAFQNMGKQKADIEIEIVDPVEESKIYGTSSVHFDADKEEEINLVLQTESVERGSEYLRITSDLQPKIGEVAFKDLQENKERQDISYLANKTGWDARLVAMVSLADEYSAASGIPAKFYFALFRAGIPTDADGLYRTNSGTVKKIWEKAIEENIIEVSFEVSLQRTIKLNIAKFEKNGSTHLLKNAKIGVSSLKELLDISLQDESKQQEFVKLYFNHVRDMSSFWAEVKTKTKIEPNAVDKLQLDGKLGYLTVNNAKLIRKLRSEKRVQESPVDLIKNGLYKPEAWDTVLGNDIPVPEDMPGETDEEKKRNYINYMVSMLKISYPTSVVAEMVHNNELPVKGDPNVRDEVYEFLQDTQDKFQIGAHPVEKFIEDNNIELGEIALNETKRLQRVYQVSPSDNAMKVLGDNNLDSALAIVQYDEKEFIETFKDELGEDIAKMTYVKANQVHSTVLNVATSYLTYRTSPRVYAISGAKENVNPHDPDLISYPTLEELFGSMDYCTCGHCKSVLSPAAYLVDLLQFIDRKRNEKENPIEVLRKRRPDIEHIQLTCENTNTVLPYIDIVNEILEYYVVNDDHTLDGFEGHNVEEITSAELLANPQFVNDEAYTTLKEQVYPFNLPFNQPLSALRLYYDYLKVPLHEAMEKLRVNDNFDTLGGARYAWREIYNEYLGISQEEYKVLTDSGTIKLPVYFGEDENVAFDDHNNKIYNAKIFSRKTGINYNELIELIKTQFINPNSHLIPKLEKLRISFADIKNYKKRTPSDVEFKKKIPEGLDRSIYGGDIKKWVKDKNNYDKFMSLILLTVPEGAKTDCEFAKSELRYSLPDNNQNLLKEIDYWRLLRFIRLWRKLGWTIEETDKAITALYKAEFKPDARDNLAKQKLDNGFKDLVVKIAHVKRIEENLNLKKEYSLIKLLALWSNIDTHGDNSLYKQMFLQSSILKIDTVFDDNGYGEYLTDPDEKIKGHLQALQAAFNVTADELSLILNDVDFDENSMLSLENVSKIYRYSFLAKALKISIQEFIVLKTMSGMDPFKELEDVHPNTLKFIELVQLIKQSGFKINTLSYFLQHEDVTGKASPSSDSILSLAKTLKDGLVGIEQEYGVEDDPTGEIAKSKMALVYENAVVDNFFGLLKGTTSYSADYNHPQPELEQELKDISDKIAYDHFQKRLDFQGVMTEAVKTNFDNAASVTDAFKTAIQELYDVAQADFSDFFDKYSDLKALYDGYVASDKPETEKIADILEDFLPSQKKKLKHLFIKQTLSTSVNVELSLLNELLEKPKILHSIEQDDKPAIEDFLKPEVNGVSAQYFFADYTSTTPDITLSGIAFNRGTVTKSEFPNIILVSKLLRVGLIKEVVNYTDYVYFSDTIKDESQLKGRLAEVDRNSDEIEQVLDIWRQTDNNLPAIPVGATAKISAIWRFYLEVPVNGNYNYYIETDSPTSFGTYIDTDLPTGVGTCLVPGVNGFYNYYIDSDPEVKITIDEKEIPISGDQDNGIWQNQDAIELKAGRLYRVELEIAKVKDKAVLKWESKGIGRESIPLKYLYPYEQVRNFSDMYIRLLKAIGIFEKLGLEEKEIAFFCTATRFQIDGKGFLNAIPVTPNPDGNKVEALFSILLDLLHYAKLKKSLNVNDETLVMILKDPEVNDENGQNLLLKVTGWDESSYEDLLMRFGWVQEDLTDLNKFIRVKEAFGVVNKFGVQAAHLVNGTTNEPVAGTVRDIQNSLRAKYEESVWRAALQPINDQLRSCQRDALVSYILHVMQKNKATENINTPDKLFEYFFIDVEMDPCMKTSRIKQANSTVQLFIQRCLMNLEPEVSPASIKADQWEWMKRYRVWEANRKIFLYPENWLEPELRDNKSPFFRDLESELLQADITDELAETALLNYLEKLDDVSKLEISGLYLQENEAGNESDDILHVFGRTTGASRKYYYRRLDGNWTPWEKVDLDIEDNPILPVVWNDRLFLFWLNIVRKGPDGKPLPHVSDDTSAVNLTAGDLNKPVKQTIEVNLSWSEYYNNKWQPRRTSDFEKPIKLGELEMGKFKREDILLSSHVVDESGKVDESGELIVCLWYGWEPYSRPISSFYFKMFNKHSAPIRDFEDLSPPERLTEFYVQLSGLRRRIIERQNLLRINYAKFPAESWPVFTHEVLKKDNIFDILETHHRVISIFEAPFFYQDKKHVFFVKPEERLTTVSDPQNVGVFGVVIPAPTIEEVSFPQLWQMPDVEPFTPLWQRQDVDEDPWILDVPVGIKPDPRAINHFEITAPVNNVLSDNRAIPFGDEIIGLRGSQYAPILYNKRIGKGNFERVNIRGVLK